MEMIFPFLLRIIFVESKRTRGASRYELCTLDPNVPATLLLHKLFFLISSPFGHTRPPQGTFWAPPLYHLYHSLTISEYDTLASFQRRPLEIRFSVGINSPERTIQLGFKVSKEAPTPLQCCSFENRFKSVHAFEYFSKTFLSYFTTNQQSTKPGTLQATAVLCWFSNLFCYLATYWV